MNFRRDRDVEPLTPANKPMRNRSKDDCPEDRSSVVHVGTVHWKTLREWHPDDDEN